MIRLVADDNIVGLEQLPAAAVEVVPVDGRALSPAQLRGADALWVRSVTPVDAELLADTSLRFLGTATAGLEHVDTRLLAARGIHFAAAPGANANAVAEYVLAALLELGEPWERLEAGASLGIVGYGAVGQRLAAIGRALGWSLRVCDPWVARQACGGMPAADADDSGPEFCGLDEILECTVISLHCSLHRRAPWPSHHLIGAGALARLSGRQWLVNAARGAVVDNAALLEHLRRAGPVNCVLDVWEGEPAFDAALLAQPALALATPHIAGYSWDAKWQATQMLYRAMRDCALVDAALSPGDLAPPALQPVVGAGTAALRAAMEQRYTIRSDDTHLRALRSSDAEARAAGFDRLRKHYPRRRELRGSVLPGKGRVHADLQRFLHAVGVTVER